MDLDKRKYSRGEVVKITDELKREYEEKLIEQKERIAELVRENEKCKAELSGYLDKDKEISEALKNAQIYSSEQKKKAAEEYLLTKNFLINFIEKWKAYFDMLLEKYPMYPLVVNAEKLREKVSSILEEKSGEEAVTALSAEMDKMSGGSDGFDPKRKIAEYIAANDDGGFNMNEVLNPGKLQLEDLCKELGLLAENEL